jgi:hypothetical protein
MGITPPASKCEELLAGKHIVPLIWIADKRVRTVELVQVIPLVLPRDQEFMKDKRRDRFFNSDNTLG